MKVTGGDRDERLMTLMELAMAVAPGERETYLRQACEDDRELYQELTERLEWERKMQGFLLEPLVPRQDNVRPFQAGDVVNSRYEIVREVAEGGMAVVYEAFDRTLDCQIAIKCPKPGFRRRLPPELRNAIKVSHPNVCRLHGIETAKTPSGEVEFLTMEFLSGQTLAEHLKSNGPLKDKEARQIVRQMCDGLIQAHRENVVHGDLKPSNIILTKDQSGDMRAVITDFGLAQQVGNTGGGLGTAQSDRLRGTPDFVAPELWKGARLSVASDMYALGVILYEMITGRRPFLETEGERRFSTVPTPPSKIVKGLPVVWDRVTSKCLDPDPAKRPAAAAEVSQVLEPRQSTNSSWWIALAAMLALIVGGWLWRARTAENVTPLRVAVLDLSTDPDNAAVARGVMVDVAERLGRLAGRSNNLVVIPSKESAANRNQDPGKAAAALGATHVVTGTLRQSGDKYAVQAQVWEAQVNGKLKDFQAEYSRAEIGSLPTALVGAVSAALNLKRTGETETVAQTAYSDYIQGIDLLRQNTGAADSAIAFLERAVQNDPASSLTHAALAEAHVLKFRQTNDRKWLDAANESARKAQARNPDTAELLMLTGLVKGSAGLYPEAVANLQRASELNPRNSEALRRLGNVYEEMGQPVDAVRAYQRAIALQPEYFKTYIDLGNHYFDQGDLDSARKQYEKATQLAPAIRDGHYSLGRALLEAGAYDEAERSFQEALRLYREGNALMGIGVIKTRQSKHHESVGFYKQAVEAGPESTFGITNLAESYRRIGDAKSARETYRRALETASKNLLENPKAAVPRAMLGYLSARLDDKTRAAQEIGQALATAPENYIVRIRAILTYEVLRDRAGSLRLLRDAPRAVVDRLRLDPDLSELHSDPRFIELSSPRN